MADTNQLSVVHPCADGVKRVFIVPSTFTLAQLQALPSIDPEKDGWVMIGVAPADGSPPPGFSTDCGAVVPPSGNVPPAPIWNLPALNTSKPPLIAGTYFEWSFKMNEVATAGTGAVLSGIRISSGPGYFNMVQQNGVYRIYGNVPSSINFDEGIDLVVSETYTIGDLSSGNETKTTVSLPIVRGDFYANYQYDAASKLAIVRIGPDGGTASIPYVTFTAPDGTVIPRQQMQVFGIAPVDGYPYYYLATISNPISGIWQAKYEFLGKTKYGTFVLSGQQKSYTGIGLTDNPSAPVVTITPTITAIDERWVRLKAGDPYAENQFYLWFNATQNGDVELWLNLDFGAGYIGFQKVAGAITKLTGDAKGYTHRFNANSTQAQHIFCKAKIVGQPDSTFIFFDFIIPATPSLTTDRVQISPVSSGNSVDSTTNTGSGSTNSSTTTTDLTTPITFNGVKSGGYRSTNPNLLNLGYSFTNGRIRNLVNTANPSVDGGKALRYLINDRWYAYQNNGWYKVNTDGSIVGQATNLSFNPELGVLVQCFMVELSRKMNGTSRDDKGWRDDGVYNASQLLRVL